MINEKDQDNFSNFFYLENFFIRKISEKLFIV